MKKTVVYFGGTMPSQIDIDNFIEIQYRKYIQHKPKSEWDYQYEEFYREFKPERLQELLTVFHAELTDLFSMMNSRLPTGEEFGSHFWADPSRDLILIIEIIGALQRFLKGTSYEFSIDEYYESLFDGCLQWLSKSGGSTIPPKTERVILYYKKPIFSLKDEMLPFKEFHELGEKAELLGRGGFGEVYRYRHPIVDIDFAVKIFNPVFASEEEKKEGEKRFFREANMLFKLNHPNIVRIYDVGRFKGKPYIKIEYIEGKTLERIRDEKGNFVFIDAARAILHVLDGLQHAHTNGIIHRDLKPNNIMVDMSGEKWICKIIDFGISAFMDTNSYTKLTMTGEHIAGGNYIDPLLQESPTLRDVRSDIYSVSAIFYFLLCGRPPIGGDIESILRKSRKNLNDEQIGVVLKSLSVDLDKRFSSCEEMKSKINRLIK